MPACRDVASGARRFKLARSTARIVAHLAKRTAELVLTKITDSGFANQRQLGSNRRPAGVAGDVGARHSQMVKDRGGGGVARHADG